MNAVTGAKAAIPFDQERVDRLMEEAGIDVLCVTSKHNTKYLLGGYSFIFFQAMDAIGHSRYLPILVYEKGRPDHAAYVGNRMEGWEQAVKPFWTPNLHLSNWGTLDAANNAVEHLRMIGRDIGRIGIEPGFLPSDAYMLLRNALPGAKLVDASGMLERMRALKTEDELRQLRLASEF